MEWSTIALIVGAILIVIGGAVWTGFKKVGAKNKNKAIWSTLLVGGVLLAFGFGVFDDFMSQSAAQTVTDSDGNTIIVKQSGEAATLHTDFYSDSTGSLTEVYPTVYVTNSKGQLITQAASNTTSTSVGDTLDVYGGGASYYCDPEKAFSIDTATEYVSVNCKDVATLSSMAITFPSGSGNNAILTADDNATNDADYSVALSAGQTEQFVARFDNAQSDKDYHLGMIATFYGNDIENFEVTDSRFKEVACPKQVKNAQAGTRNDSGTNTTLNWKNCYAVSSGVIKLEEYDDIDVEFVVTAGTTNPAAQTGDNFGAVFIDTSWVKGSDNKMYYDVHDHSTSESIANVGASETAYLGSPQGLKIGFTIEGQ